MDEKDLEIKILNDLIEVQGKVIRLVAQRVGKDLRPLSEDTYQKFQKEIIRELDALLLDIQVKRPEIILAVQNMLKDALG